MARRDLNRCEFIGRLGVDPEVRYMPNGDAAASFSLATSSSWKDKQTGEERQHTEWHRIVAFRKLAEIMGEYLRKGSQVYISGRLRTRKWQDNEGTERYVTEIVADDLQFLGGNSESSNGQANNQAARSGNAQRPQNTPPQTLPGNGGGPLDFDDDIPFAELHWMVGG